MQHLAPTIVSLAGRTILVSPSDLRRPELPTELEQQGVRVITWPKFNPSNPESYAAVDEAIENMFGYDWLILRNVVAARSFLCRFRELGHDVSELDSLSVCAIGSATIAKLEESRVHVDVFPNGHSSRAIFGAVESYVGGRNSLRGLNFLVPRAAITSGSLTSMFEEAGARTDAVTTYRTCEASNSDLSQIKGLLLGGAIDCVVFASALQVHEFAAVFDSNDLSGLLQGVAVVCINESATLAAADFDLRLDRTASETISPAMVRAVVECFGKTGASPDAPTLEDFQP